MAVALGAKKGLDFNDMTAGAISYNNLWIHINTTAYRDTSSTFWSYLDNIGAYTTDSYTTANQYYTQVNITGRGYLGNIITPCLGTGTATLTTKVTIDGKAIERTIDIHGTLTTERLIFGPPGRAVADNTQNYGYTMSGYGERVFNSSTGGADGYQAVDGGWGMLSPDSMLNLGLPVIPFYHSLKVEIKQSATGPQGGAVNSLKERAGVTYFRTD